MVARGGDKKVFTKNCFLSCTIFSPCVFIQFWRDNQFEFVCHRITMSEVSNAGPLDSENVLSSLITLVERSTSSAELLANENLAHNQLRELMSSSTKRLDHLVEERSDDIIKTAKTAGKLLSRLGIAKEKVMCLRGKLLHSKHVLTQNWQELVQSWNDVKHENGKLTKLSTYSFIYTYICFHC